MDEAISAGDDIKVSDLMTGDPIVVDPEVEISRVLGLMQEASIRHVPVVDDDGLVGMVSDRDLAFIHGLPGVFDKLQKADIEAVLQTPIAVVMKSRFLVARHVEIVSVDAPVTEAIDIFIAAGINAVPVVGDDGDVVGILSIVDILRWVGDSER